MTDFATCKLIEADIPALRSALAHIAGVGYSETCIRERLGLTDITDLRWRALPIYRVEHLHVRDALSLAIELFLLQGVLPVFELNQLFLGTHPAALLRAGVISIDDEGDVRATVSLFPLGECLIFSDHAWPKLPHPGYTSIPHDQVMFVGEDSRWLARSTTRRPVKSALDLCTGSGVHALLAASHSERVVAVDINPRAAQYTRFNAQLSGSDNIEVRVGNLYEPVREEKFDLITANPPFVPSPVNDLLFRDGGQSGEDVQQRIIEGLPEYLASGGMAQIVTEIGERDNELISDRLRSWLGGASMDIVILRLRTHSAANYAMGHAEGDYDFGTYLDSVHDWAENLKTQGYTRVVSVLLALQWSHPLCGEPWARCEGAQAPLKSANTEIESIFNAECTARKIQLNGIPDSFRIRRAGAVGLMDAQVLGGGLSANTQAQLLGRSLQIIQWLGPIEREILQITEKPLSISELLTCLEVHKEAVLSAVCLLIHKGLLNLIDNFTD